MRNTSDSNMINQKFIVTAHPICYVKPFTPLTPQIDISRNRTDEFCEPIFRSLSDEDVQLSNEYVRELQAQGVDKLVNALQDALNLLHERDCASTG